MLNALSLGEKRNLLIVNGLNKNVYLSSRNIKNLEIKPVNELNALDVLHSENIIFGDESLIGKMEEAVAL
jgi:large subunit ribosomal protein L4